MYYTTKIVPNFYSLDNEGVSVFRGVGKSVRNRTICVRIRTLCTGQMLKRLPFGEAFDENYL